MANSNGYRIFTSQEFRWDSEPFKLYFLSIFVLDFFSNYSHNDFSILKDYSEFNEMKFQTDFFLFLHFRCIGRSQFWFLSLQLTFSNRSRQKKKNSVQEENRILKVDKFILCHTEIIQIMVVCKLFVRLYLLEFRNKIRKLS